MIASAWQAFLRLLGAPFRLWRSSLLTRTVAITVTLSGLAVTVIGGYMSLTIADSLFTGRVNQILSETARATSTAQALFARVCEEWRNHCHRGSTEQNE